MSLEVDQPLTDQPIADQSYSWSAWGMFLMLVPVVVVGALYLRRYLETRGYRLLSTRLKHRNSSFLQDVEDGLTSSTFDIRTNLGDPADTRPGTDSDDVRRIMKRFKCTFDQARLIQVQERMRANGIDPQTGMPLDKRAVMFKPSSS